MHPDFALEVNPLGLFIVRLAKRFYRVEASGSLQEIVD
jgi:hypothetical protein